MKLLIMFSQFLSITVHIPFLKNTKVSKDYESILLADCLQAPPQNLYVRYWRFFFLFPNGNKPCYLAKAVSAIKCINFCFEKFNDMEWNENEIIWIVKFEENCFANLLLIWRFLVTIQSTVSLSRVWLIDEMNPGNDYYSSPDLYMGNQKAQKIEKFN